MRPGSIPSRLRGAHPRGVNGRFISRASAKGLITRATNARARERAQAREHTKRATAARKGWETRRLNDRIQRESREGRPTRPPGRAPSFGEGPSPAERPLPPREREGPRESGADIKSLDDWIDFYGEYDGDFDVVEIEVGIDYEES